VKRETSYGELIAVNRAVRASRRERHEKHSWQRAEVRIHAGTAVEVCACGLRSAVRLPDRTRWTP